MSPPPRKKGRGAKTTSAPARRPQQILDVRVALHRITIPAEPHQIPARLTRSAARLVNSPVQASTEVQMEAQSSEEVAEQREAAPQTSVRGRRYTITQVSF